MLRRQAPPTEGQAVLTSGKRLLAATGLGLVAGCGFLVAAHAPTAHADLVPGLPVTVQLPPAPIDLPPLPAASVPTVTTPTLPTPTTPADPGPSAASAAPATEDTVVAAPRAVPVTRASGVAGARRLADGRISIPVSSVVLPNRLVIERVAVAPAQLTSRSMLLKTSLRISDKRGYLVRGAFVEIHRVAVQPIRLGGVLRTALDGRVAPALHLGLLRLTPGRTLALEIRAYKTRGRPVGGVAAQRRVIVPIKRVP